MKQGVWITRVVMLVIFLGVLAYIGVYAWQGLTDPYQIIATYSYTMSDAAEATGFLVREETVIPSQGALTDILPGEGEKVGAGQAVAVLYRSAEGLERKQEIRALELELEQLDYALRRNDSVGDSAQLDEDITKRLAEIKSTVSTGDLTGLEEDTLALRSLVLKRVDTYNTTADSVAGIEAAINEVSEQLKALRAVSGQDSTTVTVQQAGVFSGLVDGYERLLTPESLDTLTVSSLRQLAARKVETDEGALGKLITDSKWYFAAILTDADAKRLQPGDKLPVRFSHDFSGEVTMTVERIGDSEGGSRVVVFSTNRALAETTLLRRQTVDVIFEEFTGVRAPKKAVRTLTVTETDEETGETTQRQETGVFVLVGAQAEFKPVEIIREGEDFYLLRGTATNRKVLRAGDEIIVSAEELYDGKVIR